MSEHFGLLDETSGLALGVKAGEVVAAGFAVAICIWPLLLLGVNLHAH